MCVFVYFGIHKVHCTILVINSGGSHLKIFDVFTTFVTVCNVYYKIRDRRAISSTSVPKSCNATDLRKNCKNVITKDSYCKKVKELLILIEF